MSSGQWRALVLLLVLLGLEIIRSPVVQAFFKGIITNPVSGITFSTPKNTTSTTQTSNTPIIGGNKYKAS